MVEMAMWLLPSARVAIHLNVLQGAEVAQARGLHDHWVDWCDGRKADSIW